MDGAEVVDDEQAAPRRVRRAHSGRQEHSLPSPAQQKARRREVHEGDDQADDDQEDDELEDDESADDGAAIPALAAARRATENVAEFTGRHPENVVAIEPRDGDWYVDVEVVESHRIPDTTDILAIYQVRLDRGGRLLSYRRIRRYSRGQLDKEFR
jgi:hypothetical protein